MNKPKRRKRARRWVDRDIGDFRRLDPMMMTQAARRFYFAKKKEGGR